MPPAGRFLKKAPQKLSGMLVKPKTQCLAKQMKLLEWLSRLFVKLFKSLAPGRAAGGKYELNSYSMRFIAPVTRCNGVYLP